jgi:hypothetical protein
MGANHVKMSVNYKFPRYHVCWKRQVLPSPTQHFIPSLRHTLLVINLEWNSCSDTKLGYLRERVVETSVPKFMSSTGWLYMGIWIATAQLCTVILTICIASVTWGVTGEIVLSVNDFYRSHEGRWYNVLQQRVMQHPF